MRKELLKYNKELREDSMLKFADNFTDCKLRILLHCPSNGAIKYLMESWRLSLEHLGVYVKLLKWGQNTREA